MMPEVISAINAYTQAAIALGVVKAMYPNDHGRHKQPARAAEQAYIGMMTTLFTYDTEIANRIADDTLPLYKMLGHIITAVEAVAGNNTPAHNAINAARDVLKEQPE